MGGAPCCEGNVTPAAEYNIWVDPEAARAVFRSKLPIEMVGWHVSRGASVLSDAEIAGDRGARHGEGALRDRVQQPRPRGLSVQTGEIGLSLADPTAMAVALDRSVGLSWSRHRVAIETQSELTRGMTVVDRLNVSADAINAEVWGAAAGESRGRGHRVDLRLAPVQGYAEGRSGGVRARAEDSMETGRNLLAGETSPYLLQHAHNPVHWRPWGEAALAEAKRRDCPILLSIGYAACHWCHVMAHESFEDAETARLDE